jgi:hypothetical protein
MIKPNMLLDTMLYKGNRTAKTKKTGFYVRCTISEEMNNHLYCKGTQTIGLTCLVDLEMAFNYKMFKDIMQDLCCWWI